MNKILLFLTGITALACFICATFIFCITLLTGAYLEAIGFAAIMVAMFSLFILSTSILISDI